MKQFQIGDEVDTGDWIGTIINIVSDNRGIIYHVFNDPFEGWWDGPYLTKVN